MTRKELVAYCLTYTDAREDYPFEGEENAVMRHKSNGKWFALILELDGELCINLKCDPMEAEFLRKVYTGVTPAWHMNKRHWNTVRVNSGVPPEALREMIGESFYLTGPKGGKSRKERV